MLVRKHIHGLLSFYYKQPHNAVVGSIQETNPINFKTVLGDWHWRYIYRNLYQKQTGQWLTPVELFRPYYSQIIGNFIALEVDKMRMGGKGRVGKEGIGGIGGAGGMIQSNNDEPLQIIEIGGGRGTNALCILDHLQSSHPQVYESLESYTIMDSSPTLLNLMRKVLIEGSSQTESKNDNGQNLSMDMDMNSNSNRHSDKVLLKEIDMLDVAEKRSTMMKTSNKQTIVVAMEVLDNLPHDKITMCDSTGEIFQGEIHPIIANENNDDPETKYEEIFTPLSDDLLQHVLPLQQSYLSTATLNHSCWIPTVACGVMREIVKARPNSSAILADFDWLPPPELKPRSVLMRRSLEGTDEPLVTCMDDIDHKCYLSAPPLCDILFPTDFEALSGYTRSLLRDNNNKAKVNVMKQNDFLSNFGTIEIEKTRGRLTGFNPLLEDFSNCSVMIMSR